MIGKKYILSAVLACSPLLSHAETYVFDSISAIQHRSATSTITGVLANDTTPSAVTFPYGTERCNRLFDIMLTQPGLYTLTVMINIIYTQPPGQPTPIPNPQFDGCNLELKP